MSREMYKLKKVFLKYFSIPLCDSREMRDRIRPDTNAKVGVNRFLRKSSVSEPANQAGFSRIVIRVLIARVSRYSPQDRIGDVFVAIAPRDGGLVKRLGNERAGRKTDSLKSSRRVASLVKLVKRGETESLA